MSFWTPNDGEADRVCRDISKMVRASLWVKPPKVYDPIPTLSVMVELDALIPKSRPSGCTESAVSR